MRLVVDAGPSDGDPATPEDVLGAYDLRLLFDPQSLESWRSAAGRRPWATR